MEEAIKNKTSTKFLVQHQSNLTENALDLELRTRKAMDHVHNLCSKAGSGLLVALRTALATVPEVKEMENNCTGFQDITSIFAQFQKTPAIFDRLTKAARRFCDENELAFGFWSQSRILDKLNTDRNDVVHCQAAVSAAALTNEESVEGVDFKGADAMVDALATFAAKHGDKLDEAAELEQEQNRRAQEELKMLRAKRGPGKR